MRYHAGDAVAGDTSTAEVFVYRGPIRPRIEEQPNGKYTIHDVPIFETHDSRGWKCDEQWMQKAVEAQRRDKNKGFNPRLIIGHTPDDPDGDEKPVVGFLDNFRFSSSEGWLYADFVDVPEHVMERFRNNEFPGRSVEVIPDDYSIPAVAVLGGSQPFFKLPDLRFSGDQRAICYSVKEQYDMAKKNENGNGNGNGGGGGEASDVSEEVRELVRQEVAKAMKSMQKNEDDEKGDKPGEQEEPGEKDKNMGDHDKKKNEADGDVERYTEDQTMTHKYDQLQAQHEELKQKYDQTQERLAQLEYRNERQQWAQKFDALRIPPGMADREKFLEHIMKVPTDQREEAFELYTKPIRRTMPSTEAADLNDADAEVDVQNFADREQEIRDFYRANIDKYRGDFARARRDYVAQQRTKAGTGD